MKYEKLLRSAFISAGAVGCVIVLKLLFPGFDFAQYETAILTAVMAWAVNLVREMTK